MLDVKLRDWFLDTARVAQLVDKANLRNMQKAGLYVRKVARNSMKKKRGAAPPGKPPHVHRGFLKDALITAYDPTTRTVVVGPIGFSSSDSPLRLETGGRATIKVRHRRRKGEKRGRVTKARVTVHPHPYMGPALENSKPYIPELWRSSLRTE